MWRTLRWQRIMRVNNTLRVIYNNERAMWIGGSRGNSEFSMDVCFESVLAPYSTQSSWHRGQLPVQSFLVVI